MTPMMQQYLEAKSAWPEAIVFFRMGDFYEVFFDDAKVLAETCDLALTARHKDTDDPVPMAGVPWHAAGGYIRRLVREGRSVAICEQLEEPGATKGIVRRGVVRVHTPGTLVDADGDGDRAHHFLVAVAAGSLRDGDVAAIAALDVSTGDLRVQEVAEAARLEAEIRRLDPAEIIVLESQASLFQAALTAAQRPVARRDDAAADLARVVRGATPTPLAEDERGVPTLSLPAAALRQRLAPLDESAFRDRKAVDQALSLVLEYAIHTQGGIPPVLGEVQVQRAADHLVLDPATTANLEIFETLMGGRRKGSLFSTIDRTVTAAGGRRLRTWLAYPLTSVDRITRRRDAVGTLVERPSLRRDLRERLAGLADIQRLCARLASGQATAREMVSLRDSLDRVPALRAELASLGDPLLRSLADAMDPCDDVLAMIQSRIVDEPPASVREGGMIRTGVSAELDEWIELTTDGKAWLLAYEQSEREATGIGSLKVRFNKVFGYYIEVTRANLDGVPEHYIRKQTIANGERYFTQDLKEYEEKVVEAESRRNELEFRIFEETRRRIVDELGRLRNTAERLAEIDAIAALAELAQVRRYQPPELRSTPGIRIVEGRHPVVETMVDGERFVPNSVHLDEQCRLALITGPNMAGKSTVIRQVAIIVLLAQIGSFVPAQEATIGVVDQIFSRVGASDNLARGQSTFMVEMTETAHILANATERSLVILDEIGRGTATWDGLSIAWAVAEHLHHEVKCHTLFATHYHELTELARSFDSVRNFNIAVREFQEKIVFLHKLVDGPASRSYGVEVARLAGVPAPVVDRARHVLRGLESETPTESGPLVRGRRGGRKAADEGQLDLFAIPATPPPDPLVESIRALDVDTLTPRDALSLIYAWKEELARRSPVSGRTTDGPP